MDVIGDNILTSGGSKPAHKSARRQQNSKEVARPGSSVKPVNRPDVDEIRRLRAAYYDASGSSRTRSIRTLDCKSPPTRRAPSDISRLHAQEEKRHRTRSSHGKSGTGHAAIKAEGPRCDRVYATSTREVMQGKDQTEQVEDVSHRETGRVRHKSGLKSIPAIGLAENDAEIQGDSTTRPASIVDRRQQSNRPVYQRKNIGKAPLKHSAKAPITNSLSRSQAGPSSLNSTLLHHGSSMASGHPTSRPQVSEPTTRGINSRVNHRKDTKGVLSRYRALARTRGLELTAAKAPRLATCLTCGADDIVAKKTAKLACGHRMCHDCLKRIFKLSVKDPAHMPPRCCSKDHIPLSHVEHLFDVPFKLRWNRKYQEYHTKNRIYCPKPGCGKWIKPAHIHSKQGRTYARCPHCTTKACVICNHIMHKSRDCPKDPGIARLVEQMEEKGWQRCYSCQAMVELIEGCNHMTCRCTAEFCMRCGSKWKTCDCPLFNARRAGAQDQLNEMRVPNPLPMLRDVFWNVVQPGRGHAVQAHEPLLREGDANFPRTQTYQNEMEQRRRQERGDAELARRLQMASLLGQDDDFARDGLRAAETWGIGNAREHFMNDDFIPVRTDVIIPAFGDSGFGRRGERTSGRRQRARQTQGLSHSGLIPNFLGDESVIGSGGHA